jgi:NlpC/P60 family
VTVSLSAIVSEVEKFTGDPYVYGAAGPAAFDCSGLVQYSLEQLGIKDVPRTSEEQWAWVDKVSKADLQPGDLVFAQFPGDNASPGHVGIYTGNGQVLSAQDPQLGVGYATLDSWGSNIVGYGRVPAVSASGSGQSSSGSSGVAATYSQLGVGGVLADVNGLTRDVATALDYVFGVFGSGQGWRIVFIALTVAAGIGAYFALASAGVVPAVELSSAPTPATAAAKTFFG